LEKKRRKPEDAKRRKPEDVEKEIAAINKEIKKKKLRWKAGKTSLSALPKNQIRQRLGLLIEEDRLKRFLKKQEERQKKRTGDPPHPSPVDPPSHWDWRNVAGTNWTTNIRDQGWCGSCVAFGVVAVLEMMVKRWVYRDAAVDPNQVDFSEAHLYFANNRHCRTYACNLPPNNRCSAPNWGWWISPALNYLKANWICNEDCFPYNGPNRPCNNCNTTCISQAPPGPPGTQWNPGQPCGLCNQPCTQALTLCPEWPYDINFTKIKDWTAITSKDEMKKVLSEHGCLVADFVVYEDFINYPGGIYEWDGNSKLLGGHAVAVVGYDDVDDCWICKNSWGTGWGEAGGGEVGGWFRIAYDECLIDDTMYKIDLFCPAEESGKAMGLPSDTITMIRSFRDNLLTTRKGRAYLTLAQENIGLVTRIFHILKRDAELRKEAMNALEPFIKAIITKDSFRPFRLKEEHFKAGILVLKKLGKRDPKLVLAVKRITEEVPRFVGKNIRQIMHELF
jgi:C1A family cysteine protease